MPKKITVPDGEFWDDVNERFYTVKGTVLTVEHSLVSISKWEQKYHKPFLTSTNMTNKEMLDYIRFMTIYPNLEESFFDALPGEVIKEIQEYINDPMTATWFNDRSPSSQNSRKQEVITNELVYYWMLKCGIPFEAEKWHFNRLMTLIRVFNFKEGSNEKGNKMSKSDIYQYNKRLNAQRKKKQQ